MILKGKVRFTDLYNPLSLSKVARDLCDESAERLWNEKVNKLWHMCQQEVQEFRNENADYLNRTNDNLRCSI